MSKNNLTTWHDCLFVAHEFSHFTNNGTGKNIAYYLAYGTIFHKFYYTSCTHLANEIEIIRPLEIVTVTFRYVRDRKEIVEIKRQGN